MRGTPWRRLALGALVVEVFLLLAGFARAGSTDLEQITPLVWVMVAISVAGAALVYGVLAYALWKFRDPRTKGRKYG